MNENEAVVVADGCRIEKFGEDVFFVDVEGAGHRTIHRSDEYIIYLLLSELFVQATQE